MPTHPQAACLVTGRSCLSSALSQCQRCSLTSLQVQAAEQSLVQVVRAREAAQQASAQLTASCSSLAGWVQPLTAWLAEQQQSRSFQAQASQPEPLPFAAELDAANARQAS